MKVITQTHFLFSVNLKESIIVCPNGNISFEYFVLVLKDPLTDIKDDNALLDSIETGMKRSYDTTLFEKGTDKYFINNQTAPYVIGTFSKTGLFDYSYDFVAMNIIVKLTDDKILLVQYVANQGDFDKSLPKVEKVLESIKTSSILAIAAR